MVFNWAGLRRSETVALKRDDVDLVAGTLRVTDGKYSKGRLVHIQPPLALVLRWYLHDVRLQDPRGRRSPALFLSPRGQALHPGGVANLLHTEQIAAGLPAEDCFTPHGLRRAYATRLYKALRAQGFRDPLVYVKEQLGHEYLSTTQRYCQLDDDYKYFLVQEATVALTRHYTSGTPDIAVAPAAPAAPAAPRGAGSSATQNGQHRADRVDTSQQEQQEGRDR
jgi:integrase